MDFGEYNGVAAPSATVEIRSRVRGYIKEVHFVDGQAVKAGDLLFELDPRPFELEIAAAKQQLVLDQAQLDASIQDENRQKELMANKAGTKSDLEKAIATRKSWEARIEISREAVRGKELDLEYSRITAPIDGLLSRALMTKGNLVNAGGSDPCSPLWWRLIRSTSSSASTNELCCSTARTGGSRPHPEICRWSTRLRFPSSSDLRRKQDSLTGATSISPRIRSKPRPARSRSAAGRTTRIAATFRLARACADREGRALPGDRDS